MRKKFLSILLTLAMIVTMIPVTAVAEGENIAVVYSGAGYTCKTVSEVNDSIFKYETAESEKQVKVEILKDYIGDITFKNSASTIVLKDSNTYTGDIITPGSVDTVFGDSAAAVINNTYYPSLESAFKAADLLSDSSEIKLYKKNDDAMESFLQTLKNSKKITLNLNGKTCGVLSSAQTPIDALKKINLKGAAAWLNGTMYPTLAEALKIAGNGERVYLLSNITEDIKAADFNGSLTDGQKVTVDLNGNTWNGMEKYKDNSKLIIEDPVYWPAYIIDKSVDPEKNVYYPTLIAAVDAAKSGETVVLQHDVTEDITIFGNKNVELDLNGKTINGDITTFGKLVIKDSSNENNKMGNGTINGKLNNDYGTICVQSGNIRVKVEGEGGYDNSKYFENESHLYSGSSYYEIGGMYIVINSGNYKCDLVYEICESGESTPVESIDADSTPDVKTGKDYTVKIFLKSNSNNVINLRGFDFAAVFEYDKDAITVTAPHADLNLYDSVKETTVDLDKERTKKTFVYTMATTNGEIKANDKVMVAQYNFKISDTAKFSGDIDLYFSKTSPEPTMTVKEFSIKIPLNINTGDVIKTIDKGNGVTEEIKGVKLNVSDKTDGVRTMDYRYAPDGYKLAVISRKIEDNKTLSYNGNHLYWTDEKAYIGMSTNPTASENERVYLLLFKPQDLYEKGLLEKDPQVEANNVTYAEIEKALGRAIEEVSLNKDESLNDTKLNYLKDGKSVEGFDIYEDEYIDYNDASIVYQMIKGGGTSWNMEVNNVSTYLSEKSRLLADSDADGKVYGTIEDVMNIINNYGKSTKVTPKEDKKTDDPTTDDPENKDKEPASSDDPSEDPIVTPTQTPVVTTQPQSGTNTGSDEETGDPGETP